MRTIGAKTEELERRVAVWKQFFDGQIRMKVP